MRKLCVEILRHKKVGYGDDKNEIRGILFDGAALWEEYLNVVLNRAGAKLTHPNNRSKSRKTKYFLFRDENQKGYREVIPDFLLNVQQEDMRADAVLDAKYKYSYEGQYDSFKDDSFQLLSYMMRFDSKRGALLYPDRPGNKDGKAQNLVKYTLWRDPEIQAYKISFNVPKYDDGEDFPAFKKKMEDAEKAFVKTISDNLLPAHKPES